MAEGKETPKSAPILTLDEIFKKPDTRYREIDVPAWGGKVRIGSLSAGEMQEWVDANEGPAKKTAGLRLIIKSLVDGEGNRILTDRHLEQLRGRDSASLDLISEEILDLNGLRKKDTTAAKNG